MKRGDFLYNLGIWKFDYFYIEQNLNKLAKKEAKENDWVLLTDIFRCL